MKTSKLFTKLIATTAMSMLLLSSVVSATTIKVPNMGGVSKEYAALVKEANDFDKNGGALIADSFTRYCYTEAALDNAIANANNAIYQLERIYFVNQLNYPVYVGATSGSGTSTTNFTTVRDLGYFDNIDKYLAGASLSEAITFDLKKDTEQYSTNYYYNYGYSERPTSEFYNVLWFNYGHKLYSTIDDIYIIGSDQYNHVKYTDNNSRILKIWSVDPIIDVLENYIDLVKAVKTYDRAAGCYGGSINPSISNAVITAKNQNVNLNKKFDIMKGVKAVDGNGVDITNKVTVSGQVNTAKAGKYTLTYNVTGANGVTVSKSITVTVKKK